MATTVAQTARRGTRKRRGGTKYISMTEIAEQTGIHYRTVRRMVERGDIPSVLLGGCRLIPLSKLRMKLPDLEVA